MHATALSMLYGYTEVLFIVTKDNEMFLMMEALMCTYKLPRNVTRSYGVLIVISRD